MKRVITVRKFEYSMELLVNISSTVARSIWVSGPKSQLRLYNETRSHETRRNEIWYRSCEIWWSEIFLPFCVIFLFVYQENLYFLNKKNFFLFENYTFSTSKLGKTCIYKKLVIKIWLFRYYTSKVGTLYSKKLKSWAPKPAQKKIT